MRKFLSFFVAALLGVTTYTNAAKAYFVNADGWTTVNAYMWADGDKKNAEWPGVAMTKTEDKAHDFEVYSYEVPDGFSNLIFNDGKAQTADLAFDAAKPYYFNLKWYATLADVEAAPVGLETVKLYFVNKDGWTKVQAYVFEGSAYYKVWPGEEMTKTEDKALEKDIYSYEFPINFTKIIFNNKEGDNGTQTADLVWDKDKPYYYDGTWFATKEDVKDVVKDPVIKIAGSWDEWTVTEMALSSDKKTATIEKTLEAKAYEFKLVDGDNNWLTKANSGSSYELKRDWPGVKDVKDDATENLKLIADVAGKYVFTWTFENDSIGITFPAETPDPEPTTGFYVTGDSALVVDAAGLTKEKAWDPKAIKSEKDTIEIALKKDVDYQLKVVVGEGEGAAWKSFNDLSDKTNLVGVDDGMGGKNIGFRLKTDGKIKVIYFVKDAVTTFKVLGDLVEVAAPTVADGFYLIGPKGWDLESIDPAQKFAETENAGEYKLEVTLVKDQEIKVVEVKDNAIKTWYPDGVDNAFKVTAAYAGARTIYFKPAGSEDDAWKAFGGFIYMEEGETPEPQPVDGFYVTGDEAFVVAIGLDKAKAWAPDALKSEKDTLVLNIAAGDYVMKVTLDGTWGDGKVKGFSDLTEKAKGLLADKDNNIVFSLTEAGVVKVIYFVKDEVVTFKLDGKFDESKVPDIADGYYLNGSHADWTVANLKNYAFTVNPDNAEEYQLSTTLTVGQKIKPVLVESGAVKTWFPETGGDYEVDAAHAGEKVVYFRPVVNAEWTMCGGHIFIAENEQAIDNTAIDAKAVKFFENGQLIIIKNGVKYNAQGAVVR